MPARKMQKIYSQKLLELGDHLSEELWYVDDAEVPYGHFGPFPLWSDKEEQCAWRGFAEFVHGIDEEKRRFLMMATAAQTILSLHSPIANEYKEAL
jgi:hypothetical protein